MTDAPEGDFEHYFNATSRQRQRAEEAEAEVARLRALADDLAVTVIIYAHDLHPVYGSTTGWRGGIGGQAITQGCSLIDPPPDLGDWAQFDLPTTEAREWLRATDIDIARHKAMLMERWEAMLGRAGGTDG